MAWTVLADSYATGGDFNSGSKSIIFTPTKNIALQFVRTWMVFIGDPALTTATMKIYYDENGTRGDLLYTSITNLTKAEIITLENGVKEVYFEFSKEVLNKDTKYHLVLTGSSAGGFTDTEHIAWKTSYPFPVYPDGFTQTERNKARYPYEYTLIGAEI